MRNMKPYLILSAVVAVFATSSAQTMIMPKLKGLTPDSAKTFFTSDTDIVLIILEDSLYTDSMPRGLIAWQDPLADSAVQDTIKVKLAAPLTVKLPDVRGVQLLEAAEIIAKMGLKLLSNGEEESEKYKPGEVISTEPVQGSMVTRGSTVGAKVSVGIPDYKYTTTSSGVRINLYEDVGFKIVSASVVTSDSGGFKMRLNLQATNPYKHSISVENLDYTFSINDATVVKGKHKLSLKIGPNNSNTGYVDLIIPYSSLNKKTAKSFLEKGRYRLYGFFNIVVESGFSQKSFDARGEIQLPLSDSKIKSGLEAISQN